MLAFLLLCCFQLTLHVVERYHLLTEAVVAILFFLGNDDPRHLARAFA